MYILIEKTHNGGNFVHFGPMIWRPSLFKSCLRDEFDIMVDLPLTNDTNQPFIFNDSVRILPVENLGYFGGTLNSKTQVENGPYFNFFDTYAEMYFNIVDRQIDIVKSELKTEIAANRYRYEIMGIDISIQNQNITALTNREDRGLYLQAFQLNKDNINWKFGSQFMLLSNADLGIIVNAVANHVQAAFDWEHLKHQEIDNCISLTELDNVILFSDNIVWEPLII